MPQTPDSTNPHKRSTPSWTTPFRAALIWATARAAATVLTTVLAIGSILLTIGAGAAGAATPLSADPPQTTKGPCKYTETPEEPPSRPVSLPRDPARTPNRGKVEVELKTNQGRIPLTLDRAKAPCTVQSFLHLVQHRFYDLTSCHRLTAYPTLKVLQCGDPSNTGEGGPGYKYKDELPTDLKPAPNDPTGQRRIYPRGLLAMANAGPNTNGSQFFLVYGDSVLRPNYTVFGTVGRPGLDTLDKVAAGGIEPPAQDKSDQPKPGDPAPVDGRPKLPTKIIRAKVDCWW